MVQGGSGEKVYFDIPCVTVTWRPADGYILIEMKAWCESSEYAAALEAALVAIREQKATKQVVDARAGRALVERDQQFVATDWLPRALAAGLKYTALVMPKSQVATVNVENIATRAPTSGSPNTRFFATLREAATWIRSL